MLPVTIIMKTFHVRGCNWGLSSYQSIRKSSIFRFTINGDILHWSPQVSQLWGVFFLTQAFDIEEEQVLRHNSTVPTFSAPSQLNMYTPFNTCGFFIWEANLGYQRDDCNTFKPLVWLTLKQLERICIYTRVFRFRKPNINKKISFSKMYV